MAQNQNKSKHDNSPYLTPEAMEKKLAFLYLGTKGRLPNKEEYQKEMS